MESIQDVFSGNYEGAWVLALGICSYAIQSYVSFKTVSSKANGKPVSVEIERQEKDVETMNENDKLMKHSNNTLEKDIPSSKLFHRFQKTYLLVYLIMTSADWLQGPYLYAVYDLHGFSMNEIGRLFIVGFVSSAVFGPWVGSLSDSM